ncbi:MAG: 16S rRNA (guanine(527)-N(7))-methyltransferase RsmG [Anaerolineales bacterium]
MSSLTLEVLSLLGIQLSEAQVTAFDTYARELIEWNGRFNLTSITDPEQIRSKHFLDSLSCWLAIRQAPPGRLIDVGSGAGFPGLPLKILRPEIGLTLVESTAKKAGFLEHLVQVLGLENVTVLAKRAEEVGQMAQHREAYDWALARAVAPLPVLAEYLLPLVRVGGTALAQKGKGARVEAEEAQGAIAQLGGELAELLPFTIPGLDEERWLVLMKKIAPSPAAYPRRPGMPGKRPLGGLSRLVR